MNLDQAISFVDELERRQLSTPKTFGAERAARVPTRDRVPLADRAEEARLAAFKAAHFTQWRIFRRVVAALESGKRLTADELAAARFQIAQTHLFLDQLISIARGETTAAPRDGAPTP